MNEQQTNLNVIKVLYANRWKIAGIAAVFFIAAVTVTFFIPKKYTAMGAIYPTSSNSIKEVVSKPMFGYDVQADRLIQLFQSQMMREKVIAEFDLIDYFEIDTTQNAWRYQLNKKYDKNIGFERTKYLSVEVSVTATSAQRAATMVNFMLDYIDEIRKDIFEKNTMLLVNDLRGKSQTQELVVDSMLNEIFSITGKGASNALAENTNKIIDERKRKATSLYGDEVIRNALENHYNMHVEKLINLYYFELGKLNNLQRDLAAGQEKLSLPFPKVYRLMSAVADEKKSSPSFLVNGILGLVFGLIFGVFYFVGNEKWKSISENLLNE